MEIVDEEYFNITNLVITENPASKLGQMAAKIAYFNFEWRFITLVMYNTIQVVGLQTFLKNYGQAVVLKLGRFTPKRRGNVPQFVIFGEQTSDIAHTIRWLIQVQYDSNAKFVIICASPNEECDEQQIFQVLTKFYVVNAIVLKTSNSTNEILAYTYRIVLPGKCQNGEPDKIDLTSDCANDKCFASLFPEKLSNFYKCRLAMSTVEQPPFMYLHNGTKKPSGIDGEIMQLAADMLNATLVLRTPSDSTDAGHYTYNNWTGSLGDIYNGRVHASVCTTPLTANKYGNFQISFTYYSMDMVWAAKLPTEKAPWEKLLYPLKIQVRMILLFTFIGIIFMNTLKDMSLWRRVRRVFRIGSSKYNLLFYSWLLFLGMPILRIPTKRSLKIILFTWIWCCFIVRSAYQAALVNSLKNPAYLDDLETLRDAIKDGYPFGGPSSLRDFYYEDRYISDNWIILDLDYLYETLDEILEGNTDFIVASNKEIIKHHLMKYNGTKQLQIIPEKIVNSPTVVYFKKYSPLTSPLSYVLRVAFEAGFVQRLYDKYLDNENNLLRRYSTHRTEPLTLYHFAGCFAVLIIGWFLSAIYFAVELICGHLDE